jgi:amino acid transporter
MPRWSSIRKESSLICVVMTTTESGLHRTLGLRAAVSVNMTQMCGIGPFITLPLMISTMGGPNALFGWIVGAALAIADGLVWAELGAALPGTGGTYVYLREAFSRRSGQLMPFLFVWTAVLFIPLTMSTGIVGFVSYLGFFLPGLTWWQQHLIDIGLVVLVVVVLYRRIESIKAITAVLWSVMVLAVLATIAASYSDFHPGMAFAFGDGSFLTGLGAGLIIAVYDYLGYNTSAYLGGEVRDPGRVLPRSIVISIVVMMVFYLALNVGVLGTVPWRDAAQSESVASLVVTQNWGHPAAVVVTGAILVAAFASVFAGLLGGSRVPFNAAREGLFFGAMGRLHRDGFPNVALVVVGVITALGTFFDLSTAINVLTTVMVLVQSLAQVAALVMLRRQAPELPRPYRQWLYPLPCIVAAVGWVYVYISATALSIVLSLVWIVLGSAAYLVWAKVNGNWPFAPASGARAGAA